MAQDMTRRIMLLGDLPVLTLYGMNNSWICNYPWRHIRVNVDGTVNPCCRYRGVTARGNSNRESLQKIINEPELKNLRQQMLAGEIPSGCSRCAHEEQSGLPSLRKLSHKMMTAPNLTVEVSLSEIEDFEFNIGDACNLKCVMCGPNYSTTWRDEAAQMGVPVLPRRQATSMEILNQLLPSLRRIRFMGGEPLMGVLHKKALRAICDFGKANEVQVLYNTNVQFLIDEETIELWKQFKLVHVILSIDAMNSQFEAIRYPGSWNQTLKVTDQLIALTHQISQLRINLGTTVSQLNANLLGDLDHWWFDLTRKNAREGSVLRTHFSWVEYPKELSPWVLTQTQRMRIVDSLRELKMFPDFENLKTMFLLEDWSSLESKASDFLTRLDQIRGGIIQRNFPNLDVWKKDH